MAGRNRIVWLDQLARGKHPEWYEAAPALPYSWPDAERFGSRSVNFRSQFERVVPARGVIGLAGGSVLGSEAWVVDRSGRLVPELSWYGRDLALLRRAEPTAAKPQRRETLAGSAVTLGSNWGSHYGHFITDVIGRVAVFLAAGCSFDEVDHVLLNAPPESAAARAVLDALGLPRSKLRLLEWDVAYVPDLLLAPTLPGLRRQYLPLVADLLRPFAPSRTPTRRLLVTRAGFARNPRQWAQIENLARERDFEVYDPIAGGDQLADFAAAAAIVGVSGSALTNIVFASPGTPVLELFSDAHLYGYYYSLAGAAGHPYGYVVGTSGGTTGRSGASTADFDLDLEAVAEALDWVVTAR